jgi:hypothetical protein
MPRVRAVVCMRPFRVSWPYSGVRTKIARLDEGGFRAACCVASSITFAEALFRALCSFGRNAVTPSPSGLPKTEFPWMDRAEVNAEATLVSSSIMTLPGGLLPSTVNRTRLDCWRSLFELCVSVHEHQGCSLLRKLKTALRLHLRSSSRLLVQERLFRAFR